MRETWIDLGSGDILVLSPFQPLWRGLIPGAYPWDRGEHLSSDQHLGWVRVFGEERLPLDSLGGEIGHNGDHDRGA